MLLHLMHDGGAGVRGWSIAFLEDGPMVAHLRSIGVDTHVVPAGRLRQPYCYARTVIRLNALVRRLRPDVVFGWMTKAHLYGGAAARLSGVPAAWYELGIPNAHDGMDRMALRIPARGIFTCSTNAARRRN